MLMADRNGDVPELLTARTRMRRHTTADLESLARIWADADVVRYISGKASTRSESWARLLRYIGHWHALGFGYWAVEDRQTGAYIGEVGFADFKRDLTPSIEGVPEIGWILAPHVHGMGIASETVAAALLWADRHFETKRTVCLFDPEHRVSIRVASKNGYVEPETQPYQDKSILLMERYAPG